MRIEIMKRKNEKLITVCVVNDYDFLHPIYFVSDEMKKTTTHYEFYLKNELIIMISRDTKHEIIIKEE